MNLNSSMRRVMSLAAMIAVLAGTAAAQAQQGEGSFDQPLKSRRAPEASARSTMTMSESDGEHTYTVKIEGDKVTGEVDGKELPADRVRQRSGRVEILDEDGEVMKSFNTRVIGSTPFATVAPRWRVEPLEPGAMGGAQGGTLQLMQPGTPPKAMMGITMTDAEEGGALVDSVMDGLPAEKAGLKPGDRVVKANGKDVDGQQTLREIIREADAGDTLTLTVDRDGKKQEIKVKLAKWDQGKLAPAPMPDVFRQFQTGDRNLAAAREALEKAVEQLKDQKRLEGQSLEKLRESLRTALDKLEDVKAHGFLGDDSLRFYGKQGQVFVPPTPAPPAAVNQDLERQLDRLNSQMERLNRRLDELENNRR